MLETQIAEIVVNSVAALEERIELGAMRGGIGSVGLDYEDEENGGASEQDAGAEDRGVTHQFYSSGLLIGAYLMTGTRKQIGGDSCRMRHDGSTAPTLENCANDEKSHDHEDD